MSRAIGAALVAKMLAESASYGLLVIMKIEHSAITTIRICNNEVDVVSNGSTYNGHSFEDVLPPDVEGERPEVTFKLDNVDQSLTTGLRTATSEPTVTMDLVELDDLDTSIATFVFELTQREFIDEDEAVVITLGLEKMLDRDFPGGLLTPDIAPALF